MNIAILSPLPHFHKFSELSLNYLLAKIHPAAFRSLLDYQNQVVYTYEPSTTQFRNCPSYVRYRLNLPIISNSHRLASLNLPQCSRFLLIICELLSHTNLVKSLLFYSSRQFLYTYFSLIYHVKQRRQPSS